MSFELPEPETVNDALSRLNAISGSVPFDTSSDQGLLDRLLAKLRSSATLEPEGGGSWPADISEGAVLAGKFGGRGTAWWTIGDPFVTIAEWLEDHRVRESGDDPPAGSGDTLDPRGDSAGEPDGKAVNGTDGDDDLTGTAGADHVQAGDGDDMVHAGGSSDAVEGGEGADRLFGEAGADVLAGGAGADEIDGGDGYDTADYSESGEGVIVDLAAGTGEGGDAAGDELASIEAVVGSSHDDVLKGSEHSEALQGRGGHDRLSGGGERDLLRGGRGNDTIDGGGGDDRIGGGGGDDVLTGGLGDDTFVFRPGGGNDTITDFDPGAGHGATLAGSGVPGDAIDLTAFGLDGFDALHDSIEQVGDDVVITLETDGTVLTITLQDVLLSELSADDFLF